MYSTQKQLSLLDIRAFSNHSQVYNAAVHTILRSQKCDIINKVMKWSDQAFPWNDSLLKASLSKNFCVSCNSTTTFVHGQGASKSLQLLDCLLTLGTTDRLNWFRKQFSRWGIKTKPQTKFGSLSMLLTHFHNKSRNTRRTRQIPELLLFREAILPQGELTSEARIPTTYYRLTGEQDYLLPHDGTEIECQTEVPYVNKEGHTPTGTRPQTDKLSCMDSIRFRNLTVIVHHYWIRQEIDGWYSDHLIATKIRRQNVQVIKSWSSPQGLNRFLTWQPFHSPLNKSQLLIPLPSEQGMAIIL